MQKGELAMLAKFNGTVLAVTTACVITWVGNAEILITTATISQGELD